MSDDRRHGLSIIAFVGSVFSPYYAAQRRRGLADPENHVAINLAIYGAGGYRWAMTERSRSSLVREANALSIGPSQLFWRDDGTLVVDVDEISFPTAHRVRGRISVIPESRCSLAIDLDPEGRHLWCPIAPRARIEVALDGGSGNWSGCAYVDHNMGVEPLEAAFRTWSWSRTIERERTRIFYDTVLRSGATRGSHLMFDRSDVPQPLPPHEAAGFGRSRWRLSRVARSDLGTSPRLLNVWEDGPFYTRNLIEQCLDGEFVPAVHEALSLDRFSRRIVQAMLPFRMPRRR